MKIQKTTYSAGRLRDPGPAGRAVSPAPDGPAKNLPPLEDHVPDGLEESLLSRLKGAVTRLLANLDLHPGGPETGAPGAMNEQVVSKGPVRTASPGATAETSPQPNDHVANPFGGAYVYDRYALRPRTAQGDEETSSREQELAQEQGALGNRLKELGLLIDRSTSLRDWFQERDKTGSRIIEANK